MNLRVPLGRRFEYAGQVYDPGDELTLPDDVAVNLLRAGLVLPVDGVWPEDVSTVPETAATASGRPPGPAQAAEPAVTTTHDPCDAGLKPKGARAMQTCPVAGCPCLTWQGKCKGHRRTSSTTGREYDTGHRNVSQPLRRRWESVRREYLIAHPACECGECMAMPAPLRPTATEVDHVDGLGLLGPRAFDWSNLQALTKAHHSRKTAGESFGR